MKEIAKIQCESNKAYVFENIPMLDNVIEYYDNNFKVAEISNLDGVVNAQFFTSKQVDFFAEVKSHAFNLHSKGPVLLESSLNCHKINLQATFLASYKPIKCSELICQVKNELTFDENTVEVSDNLEINASMYTQNSSLNSQGKSLINVNQYEQKNPKASVKLCNGNFNSKKINLSNGVLEVNNIEFCNKSDFILNNLATFKINKSQFSTDKLLSFGTLVSHDSTLVTNITLAMNSILEINKTKLTSKQQFSVQESKQTYQEADINAGEAVMSGNNIQANLSNFNFTENLTFGNNTTISGAGNHIIVNKNAMVISKVELYNTYYHVKGNMNVYSHHFNMGAGQQAELNIDGDLHVQASAVVKLTARPKVKGASIIDGQLVLNQPVDAEFKEVLHITEIGSASFNSTKVAAANVKNDGNLVVRAINENNFGSLKVSHSFMTGKFSHTQANYLLAKAANFNLNGSISGALVNFSGDYFNNHAQIEAKKFHLNFNRYGESTNYIKSDEVDIKMPIWDNTGVVIAPKQYTSKTWMRNSGLIISKSKSDYTLLPMGLGFDLPYASQWSDLITSPSWLLGVTMGGVLNKYFSPSQLVAPISLAVAGFNTIQNLYNHSSSILPKLYRGAKNLAQYQLPQIESYQVVDEFWRLWDLKAAAESTHKFYQNSHTFLYKQSEASGKTSFEITKEYLASLKNNESKSESEKQSPESPKSEKPSAEEASTGTVANFKKTFKQFKDYLSSQDGKNLIADLSGVLLPAQSDVSLMEAQGLAIAGNHNSTNLVHLQLIDAAINRTIHTQTLNSGVSHAAIKQLCAEQAAHYGTDNVYFITKYDVNQLENLGPTRYSNGYLKGVGKFNQNGNLSLKNMVIDYQTGVVLAPGIDASYFGKNAFISKATITDSSNAHVYGSVFFKADHLNHTGHVSGNTYVVDVNTAGLNGSTDVVNLVLAIKNFPDAHQFWKKDYQSRENFELMTDSALTISQEDLISVKRRNVALSAPTITVPSDINYDHNLCLHTKQKSTIDKNIQAKNLIYIYDEDLSISAKLSTKEGGQLLLSSSNPNAKCDFYADVLYTTSILRDKPDEKELSPNNIYIYKSKHSGHIWKYLLVNKHGHVITGICDDSLGFNNIYGQLEDLKHVHKHDLNEKFPITLKNTLASTILHRHNVQFDHGSLQGGSKGIYLNLSENTITFNGAVKFIASGPIQGEVGKINWNYVIVGTNQSSTRDGKSVLQKILIMDRVNTEYNEVVYGVIIQSLNDNIVLKINDGFMPAAADISTGNDLVVNANKSIIGQAVFTQHKTKQKQKYKRTKKTDTPQVHKTQLKSNHALSLTSNEGNVATESFSIRFPKFEEAMNDKTLNEEEWSAKYLTQLENGLGYLQLKAKNGDVVHGNIIIDNKISIKNINVDIFINGHRLGNIFQLLTPEGLNLFNLSKESKDRWLELWHELAGKEPMIAAINDLMGSDNVYEKLVHGWDTGVIGLNLFNELLNGINESKLKHAIAKRYGYDHAKIELRVTLSKTSLRFQTLAADGDIFCNYIDIEGRQLIFENGANLAAINAKFDVDQLIMKAAELNSQNKVESLSLGIGVKCDNACPVSVNAGYQQDKTIKKEYVNSQINIYNELYLCNAKSVDMSGQIKAGKLKGHPETVVLKSNLNTTSTLKADAGLGVATNGAMTTINVSGYYGKGHSETLCDEGKTFIDANDASEFSVHNLESVGAWANLSGANVNNAVGKILTETEKFFGGGANLSFGEDPISSNNSRLMDEYPVDFDYDNREVKIYPSVTGANIDNKSADLDVSGKDLKKVIKDWHMHVKFIIPVTNQEKIEKFTKNIDELITKIHLLGKSPEEQLRSRLDYVDKISIKIKQLLEQAEEKYQLQPTSEVSTTTEDVSTCSEINYAKTESLAEIFELIEKRDVSPDERLKNTNARQELGIVGNLLIGLQRSIFSSAPAIEEDNPSFGEKQIRNVSELLADLPLLLIIENRAKWLLNLGSKTLGRKGPVGAMTIAAIGAITFGVIELVKGIKEGKPVKEILLDALNSTVIGAATYTVGHKTTPLLKLSVSKTAKVLIYTVKTASEVTTMGLLSAVPHYQVFTTAQGMYDLGQFTFDSFTSQAIFKMIMAGVLKAPGGVRFIQQERALRSRKPINIPWEGASNDVIYINPQGQAVLPKDTYYPGTYKRIPFYYSDGYQGTARSSFFKYNDCNHPIIQTLLKTISLDARENRLKIFFDNMLPSNVGGYFNKSADGNLNLIFITTRNEDICRAFNIAHESAHHFADKKTGNSLEFYCTDEQKKILESHLRKDIINQPIYPDQNDESMFNRFYNEILAYPPEQRQGETMARLVEYCLDKKTLIFAEKYFPNTMKYLNDFIVNRSSIAPKVNYPHPHPLFYRDSPLNKASKNIDRKNDDDNDILISDIRTSGFRK